MVSKGKIQLLMKEGKEAEGQEKGGEGMGRDEGKIKMFQ